MPTFVKQAPAYFTELWKEAENAQEKLAAIFGVGSHWLKNAKSEAIHEKIEKLSRGEKLKADRILDFGLKVKEYAWSRFRLELMDTDPDMSNAEFMTYDTEKHTITARTGIVEEIVGQLGESLKKLFNFK